MSSSKLVSYTRLSPNCSSRLGADIDTITIHCMAGNLTVEGCGALFARAETQASSNYGIGSDGRIALYVPEEQRSWATSSKENDCRAVTIEVANNGGAPDWPVSDKAYQALIELVTDICRRNGIPKLLWKGDKALVGKVTEQNMTVHRWFANKACPGDYLYNRHGAIAAAVNARLMSENPKKGEKNVRYQTMAEIPDYAQPAVKRLIAAGKLNGKSGKKDAQGFPTELDLSEDMIRLIVMLG